MEFMKTNKKLVLIGIVLLSLLVAGVSISREFPEGQVQTETTAIFTTESVTASATVTSGFIDLYNCRGFFSVQYLITGDGTLTLTYSLSNDGSTYITPTGAVAIGTALTKTTGPGGDGKDILSFTPMVARFMKIIATETGGANTAILTLTPARQ